MARTLLVCSMRGRGVLTFQILHNIILQPPSFDTGSDTAGMSAGSRLANLRFEPSTNTSEITALLVDSPDSWSFQHWIDGASHTIAQSSHLASGNVAAMTGGQSKKLIDELWTLMGFDEQRIMHTPKESVILDRLIYASRSALRHPYLTWRSMEMLGAPWANPDIKFDQSTKKTISLQYTLPGADS